MWMVKSSRKLVFILVSYSLHKHSQTIAYRLQKNSFQTTSMYVFQKFSFVVAFLFIRHKTSSRLLRKAFYRYKMKFESLTIIWACIVCCKSSRVSLLGSLCFMREKIIKIIASRRMVSLSVWLSLCLKIKPGDKFGQLVVSWGFSNKQSSQYLSKAGG